VGEFTSLKNMGGIQLLLEKIKVMGDRYPEELEKRTGL
jgi:hypothetical protein